MISSNDKRLVKNTLYMYFRMGITMLVQLYTSRVVLNVLGVEDYGIYNVVGSFVVAFAFINGPLTTATQRFLNFELGRSGSDNEVNKIFNLGFYINIFLAVLLFFVVEFVGTWYIEQKMQLPPHRLDAARWAFHFSVVGLIVNILRTSFEAVIIAKENLSFYAFVSIFEVSFKLLNAFLLILFSVDKLKLYAVNQLVILILVFIVLVIYCLKCFSDIRIRPLKSIWDRQKFNEIIGFSGWSLFGSMASMSANQGINVLLNYFFGVLVNAAMGVATQVNTAVIQFVTSFQTAFRPQLVKYYASNEIKKLHGLITTTSKFSYLLLFTIICPICFNIDFLLKIWLKTVPDYSGYFSVLMLIYALLESLSAPMWMTVQATGRIKYYQICISIAMFMNLVISYIFLSQGASAYAVLIIKCCLDVFYLVIRLCFIKHLVGYSLASFLKKTLVPILIVTVIIISLMVLISRQFESGLARLLITCPLFVLLYLPLVYFVALSREERAIIVENVKSKFGRV